MTVPGLSSPDNFLLVMVLKGATGFEIDEVWWRPTGMRGAVSPKLNLAADQANPGRRAFMPRVRLE